MGLRNSFGLFLAPMTVDLGWSASGFALAIALQVLVNGLFQPICGQLADRFGGRVVIMGGAVLYALGIIGMALSTGLTLFTFFAGIVMGAAVSAAGMPIISASLTRMLPAAMRGRAVGLGTAGSSFGQFLVVPLAQLGISFAGGQGALFLSIMAGRSIASMQAALGAGTAVVRAMPNTPAAIRQGFTAAFAGPGVTAAQKALADALLAAIGEVAWVDQEDHINPVTAVSGGGPAYVFLLAEVLEAAAVEQGLPRDLARRMARATVAGSGALLGASEQDAADLRRAVTSPKGTTERALAVLMEPDAWPKTMSHAIQAATDRARELAG
jgi:pyrroline-5-carboxylate reductase